MSTSSSSDDVSVPDITPREVDEAQQAWCDGLLKISRLYREGGDYRGEAESFIDEVYDFAEGQVFFRPTLAMAPQNLRTTREGAISYFIGEDDDFPDDEGFAKKPWISARYDNAIEDSNAIQIHRNIALTMGNVYLRQDEVSLGGKEVVVDKVFAFRKDQKGKLRLCVHKSALSNIPESEVPEDPKVA
jgi:hypothetical protein